MFAFLGTAYTATASIENTAGTYCDKASCDHKCGDNCKKNCKKAKKNKNCSKTSAKKKGCCAKGSTAAAKSCKEKPGSKTSTISEEKSEEKK